MPPAPFYAKSPFGVIQLSLVARLTLALVGGVSAVCAVNIGNAGAQPLGLKLSTSAEPQSTPVNEQAPDEDPFVELITKTHSFELFNRSSVSLMDLKRGAARLPELPTGSQWSADEQPLNDLFGEPLPPTLEGRFKLEEWAEALRDTLPEPPAEGERSAQQNNPTPPSQNALVWASFHLKTAGFSSQRNDLKRLEQGGGALGVEEAVVALRWASPQLVSGWAELESPLALDLVAYAARFAPPSLLQGLMGRLSPEPSPAPSWRPAGFQELPSAQESLTVAFERHGSYALAALLPHEAWAQERGFDDSLLAFALGERAPLLQALKERSEGAARLLERRLDALMSAPLDSLYQTLLKAQARGAQDDERKASIELAYRLHTLQQRVEVSRGALALCGALDASAQRALNQQQLTAAEAYLTLARGACHGADFFMARAAGLMAARGDSAYFEGDFERAQHAYRGALMLQDDPLHRIRFIDALSQLALRANATGELTRARKLIDEAREWDNTSLPHRALLALADDLMPRVDHRARLGLILLIAVLGVIVTLRLVRLLSEPRYTPRGSTHTTPNAHREGSP